MDVKKFFVMLLLLICFVTNGISQSEDTCIITACPYLEDTSVVRLPDSGVPSCDTTQTIYTPCKSFRGLRTRGKVTIGSCHTDSTYLLQDNSCNKGYTCIKGNHHDTIIPLQDSSLFVLSTNTDTDTIAYAEICIDLFVLERSSQKASRLALLLYDEQDNELYRDSVIYPTTPGIQQVCFTLSPNILVAPDASLLLEFQAYAPVNKFVGWEFHAVSTKVYCNGCDQITWTGPTQRREMGCGLTETIWYTWNGTDNCGRKSTYVAKIGNEDTTPPTIVAKDRYYVRCGSLWNLEDSILVTDVCDDDVEVHILPPPLFRGCGEENLYLITARDDCDNDTTKEVNIIVINDPPDLEVPGDTTVGCDDDLTDYLNSAVAMDDCGLRSLTHDFPGIEYYACTGGSVLVTWTAIDDCGLMTTGQATVTIDVPTLRMTPPGDMTMSCIEIPDTSVTGVPTLVGPCTQLTVTYTDTLIYEPCTTRLERTWIARDTCGRTQRALQTIMLVDTTAPVFVQFPTDVVKECDGRSRDVIFDACLAALSLQVSDDCSSVRMDTLIGPWQGNNCSSSREVTFSITDSCGNQTQGVWLFRLVDTTPPVVNCPPKVDTITIEVTGPDCLTALDVGISASDLCGRTTITGHDVCYDCSDVGLVPTLYWTVTDDCGNEEVCYIRVAFVSPDTAECLLDIQMALGPDCTAEIEVDDVYLRGACIDTAMIFVAVYDTHDIQVPNPVTEAGIYTAKITNTSGEILCESTVEVLDQLPPVMTCPNNVFLGCGDCVDPSCTGRPTWTDECSDAHASYTDVRQGDTCTYEIHRTWVVTDVWGNTASCVQVITLEDDTPPMIVCPMITDTIVYAGPDCEASFTLPLITASDDCTPNLHYQITIDKFRFMNNGGATVTLGIGSYIAYYEVTDACGNTANCLVRVYVEGSGGVRVRCHDYDVPPSQDSCTTLAVSQLVDVTGTSCCGSNITIQGSLDGRVYSDSVEVCCKDGRVRVFVRVIDACGDTTICTSHVTGSDTKPAVVDCKFGIITTIGADCSVPVEAWRLVSSVYDACCGTDVRLSFSADPNDDIRIYNCDSLIAGEETVFYVEIWSTDCNGNQQRHCTRIPVTIQDNSNFCPDDTVMSISGTLLSSTGHALSDVQVSLSPGNIDSMFSDRYAFVDMSPGSYEVIPSKDDDHMQGISTADLVILQRHLLGKKVLTTPYEYIAADVNNSQELTAADISELRRLILGRYAVFPDNTSWRFVRSDYVFTDPTAPWGWDETGQATSMQDTIDFVGVKIGDIDGSASLTGGTITRSPLEMTIVCTLVDDETWELAFQTSEPVELIALESFMDWQGNISSFDYRVPYGMHDVYSPTMRDLRFLWYDTDYHVLEGTFATARYQGSFPTLLEDRSSVVTAYGEQEIVWDISFAPDDMRAFPNPVCGDMTVLLPYEEGTLTLHALTGEMLITRKVTGSIAQIDMSTYARGMYVLSWSMDTQCQYMTIVKQ